MTRVPRLPMLLGLSGLLPALAAVAVLLAGPPGWRPAAFAIGFAYAALIYSFLGGMWWGLAARDDRPPPAWAYPVAVVPSLIALACAAPWLLATGGRAVATIVLGAAIVASPLVDLRYRRHGLAPAWWLGLRLPLSLGLGLLTVAIGLSG